MTPNPADDIGMRLEDDDIAVEVKEFRPVPEGLYEVEFINVERTTSAFGDGVKLIYRIAEGPEADAVIDEIASLKGGHGSKLKERLDALRGQPFRPGEVLRPRQLFGAHARAYVITKEVVGQDGQPFRVNRIHRLSPLSAPANGAQGAAPPPSGSGAAPRPVRRQVGPQDELPDEAWASAAPPPDAG